MFKESKFASNKILCKSTHRPQGQRIPTQNIYIFLTNVSLLLLIHDGVKIALIRFGFEAELREDCDCNTLEEEDETERAASRCLSERMHSGGGRG